MTTTHFRNLKRMNTTTGQFVRNPVESAATVTGGAMTKNLRRAATTLMAILLVTASAWAGNHQICFQIPPVPGSPTLAARFVCRTDGMIGGCTVLAVFGNVFTPPVASVRQITLTAPRFDGGMEVEAVFRGPGEYSGAFQFSDGTMRQCKVEIQENSKLRPDFGFQERSVLGFNTDASGLVMTGVWQATSIPADPAFQEVIVPPDFIAVGGGAEGAEAPGTLVTTSHMSGLRSWLAGVSSNPPGSVLSPAIAFGIGLKIEGVPNSTLQQIVQFPLAISTGPVAFPIVSLTKDNAGVDLVSFPQTTAAIGGGVQAMPMGPMSLFRQYVTTTAPAVLHQCYSNGTCEQLVRGWVAESKDHINSSPGFVAAIATTLPKVLTINGTTFHVETAVTSRTSAVMAHPAASVGLPPGFALTGIGAFVNWRTSSGAAGNLVWRLKPRGDIDGVGVDAASKDQWFSSPAAITAFAIGMKLVQGPVPTLINFKSR